MCQHNLPCSIVLPTACFPEGPSPHFTFCSFWRRRPRLEAVNGDNHIQNFHLGMYIVGYTFGNHVLRLRSRVVLKLNFRPYIRRYTSPNEKFEYSYPLINLTNEPAHECLVKHRSSRDDTHATCEECHVKIKVVDLECSCEGFIT